MGPLRALVNSAGIGWATRTIGKDGSYDSAHDLDVFRKVIEINLIGTFNCIRLAATAMSHDRAARGRRARRHRQHGVGRRLRRPDRPGLLLGLQGRRRRHDPARSPVTSSAVGIRVNTIAPGLIDTPIYGEGEGSEAFKANLEKGVLFPKRLGCPEELASMVVELLANSYMNAETIRVDGGIRMPPK